MKVGVLTVSRRQGWEDIATESLAKQTFSPTKWVVISEKPLKCPFIPAPPQTRVSNLNSSLNLGLQELSEMDYVIFYQDYIKLPPESFHKLVSLASPDTFVTTLTINPPDKKPDPRAVPGEPPRACRPEEWEANVGIAPMGIINYLGGFDEEYDDAWSWDNVNLAVRASMLGCKFIIDPTNNPELLHHDKNTISKLNGDFHARRMQEIAEGKFPLRLNYLTSHRAENHTS